MSERTIRIGRPNIAAHARRLGVGEARGAIRANGRQRIEWWFSPEEAVQIADSYRVSTLRGTNKTGAPITGKRVVPARVVEKIAAYAADMLADPFCPYSEHEAIQRAREAYLPLEER